MVSSLSDAGLRFRVTGMDCANCGAKIENAVRRVPGVTDAAVSVSSRTLKVTGPSADPTEIERQVVRLGYEIDRAEVGGWVCQQSR